MRRRYICFQVTAFGLAAAITTLLAARFLITPAAGDVLIIASARQADSVQAGAIELHSPSGWFQIGTFSAQAVPVAPQTATLLMAQAALGNYDGVRVAGRSYAARVTVDRNVVATALVAVEGGLPAAGGFYAGSQDVSIGLNELSGQMKAVPDFTLIDQFARPFTRSSLIGHAAVLASFRTSCRSVCPIYTGLFLQLRRQLPSSVALLEATTDPSTDSPQVLRDYAGRIGASWTFLTGSQAALATFWQPFGVDLNGTDLHRSVLAVIDSHGYIRSYYLGAPDVGGGLSPELERLLDGEGQQLLRTHGSNWGAPQVLDALGAMGGLAQPGAAAQGQAPDFQLAALDGRQASLSEFRGRPVVINFWATYCQPCRREMPLLDRVAKARPKVVLLFVDERDDRAAANKFIRSLGISSTVVFDPDGKIGDLYRVTGLPTTVFIREDGSIEGRYLGETNEPIIEPHLSGIGA